MARFVNPANGHQVHVGTVGPFLGTLFLGGFYLLAKGSFKHFLLSWIAAICTLCVSWLIYPFFAPGILRNHWLERGYKQV